MLLLRPEKSRENARRGSVIGLMERFRLERITPARPDGGLVVAFRGAKP